jgi:hypothetical protein
MILLNIYEWYGFHAKVIDEWGVYQKPATPQYPILSKLSNRCDVHTYNIDSKSKPYCAMYICYLYK